LALAVLREVDLATDPAPLDPGAMGNPTDLERFSGYVRDFELAYLTDDWTRLAPWLAPDAIHEIENGGTIAVGGTGAAAVIADLRDGVLRMDRRFDVRIPEVLSGPQTRPDGVYMTWRLRFHREGLPDLVLEGDHRTVFDGGRIVAIHERLAPGAAARAEAYLAEHDAALRPAGSPFAPPRAPRDLEHLSAATARSLLRSYGSAKSEQDVGAALAVCSEGFRLEAVSLGLESKDRKETEQMLHAFFGAFPDYAVTLDAMAVGDGTIAAWGRARMSFRGAWLGLEPTGRTAELPVFCVMGVDGGQLTSERFFFDRAELCAQTALPLAKLETTLAALRAQDRA